MNEHGFIQKIHGKLPQAVYRWKINDTNQLGVSDAFYSGPEGLLFVEYKWKATLPKRAATILHDLGVSPIQRHWLRGRHSDNISIAVIVGLPEGALIFPGLSWEDALSVGVLRDQVVPHLAVADWITSHCLGAGHGNSQRTNCSRKTRCSTIEADLHAEA
jgi:hypothetical protein